MTNGTMAAPQVETARQIERGLGGKVAIAASVAALTLFFCLIGWILSGQKIPGDDELLRVSARVATSETGKWLTPAASIVSMFGNWQILVPVGVVLLILAVRRRLPWAFFGFYVAGCGLSGSVILLVKHLVDRPRQELVPALEKAPFASFPSGHSLYALVAYGFLAAAFYRRDTLSARWRAVFLTLATVIPVLCGISRVYLGTHYPSDVVGGYLLGLPCLFLVTAWFERFGHKGSPGR